MKNLKLLSFIVSMATSMTTLAQNNCLVSEQSYGKNQYLGPLVCAPLYTPEKVTRAFYFRKIGNGSFIDVEYWNTVIVGTVRVVREDKIVTYDQCSRDIYGNQNYPIVSIQTEVVNSESEVFAEAIQNPNLNPELQYQWETLPMTPKQHDEEVARLIRICQRTQLIN